MADDPEDDATTSNVVVGDVFGTVVQTGAVHGDLHIHSAPVRRRPTTIAQRLAQRSPWLASVLGAPGSGKSAVLAHLLVAADRPVPTPGPLPPTGTFAVAVHASGLTRDEVLTRLAHGLDLDCTTSAELIVALRSCQRVPVVLVDAVEEASTVDAARDIATLLPGRFRHSWASPWP